MTLIEEIQKVINELPIDKANKLKSWLIDLEATRFYKHVEAYAMSLEVITRFEGNKGNALLN